MTMNWASALKAPQANGDEPIQDKSKEKLMKNVAVLDTNAIINSVRVHGYVDSVVSVKEVMAEVKDKQSKLFLQTLPYEVQILEPNDESMQAVTSFARSTGDLGGLSYADLRVLALTHMLEVQMHGTQGIKTSVPKAQLARGKAAEPLLPGWGVGKDDDEWEDEGVDNNIENNTATQSRVQTASSPLLTPSMIAQRKQQQQERKEQQQKSGVIQLNSGSGDKDECISDSCLEAAGLHSDLAARVEAAAQSGPPLTRQDLLDSLPDEVPNSVQERLIDDVVDTANDGIEQTGQQCVGCTGDQYGVQHNSQGQQELCSGSNSQRDGHESQQSLQGGTSGVLCDQQHDEHSNNEGEQQSNKEDGDADDWAHAVSRSTRRRYQKKQNRLQREAATNAQPSNSQPSNSTPSTSQTHDHHAPKETPPHNTLNSTQPASNDQPQAHTTPQCSTEQQSSSTAAIRRPPPAPTPLALAASQTWTQNPTSPSQYSVACITSDFGMQNVAIQMGLKISTADGRVIRSIARRVLRCPVCKLIIQDTSRIFCRSCGHSGLQSVSVKVEQDGQLTYGVPKQTSLRGTKFSLPRPKGGKNNSDPILSEDVLRQRMPVMFRSMPKHVRDQPSATIDPHGAQYGMDTWFKQNLPGRKGVGVKSVLANHRNNPNEPKRKGKK